MELSASSIVSKLDTPAEWLAGLGSALYFSTKKWQTAGNNPGSDYPFNKQGIADMLSQMGVPKSVLSQLQLPTGGAASFSINPIGVINTGTIGSIIADFLLDVADDAVPTQFRRLGHKVASGVFWGSAIGGFFDPPISGSTYRVPSGSTADQANRAQQYNRALEAS